jgi:hypothetical protein
MLGLYWLVKGYVSRKVWAYRFENAPIKKLGRGRWPNDVYVKEIDGNLYMVERPLLIPSDIEIIEGGI